MPGGLIQLAAVGAEMVNLIGNPQMTHFKMVYKRYSNFAMEPIELTLNGSPDLFYEDGIILSCKIDRHADLLSNMYLVVDLPDIYSGYMLSIDPLLYPTLGYRFQWIKELGTRMIDYVELYIGSQLIQKLNGDWIQLWHEMYSDESIDIATFNHMTGNTPDMHSPATTPQANGVYPTATLDPLFSTDPELTTSNEDSTITNPYLRVASIRGRTLYIPLHFWFSRKSGLALPLVALQQHEVHVNIRLRPLKELYTVIDTDSTSPTYCKRVPPQINRVDQHIYSFVPVGQTTQDQRKHMQNNAGQNFRRSSAEDTTNTLYIHPRLLCTYIFLDETEQKRFATTTHKYLIEREEYRLETGIANTYIYNLHLNHPVKTLIWYLQHEDVITRNDWENYLNWKSSTPPFALLAYQPKWGERVSRRTGDVGNDLESLPLPFTTRQPGTAGAVQPLSKFDYPLIEKHIMKEALVQLNGIELFCIQPAHYFNYIQSYQHHMKNLREGVYSYNFALSPRSLQPSGACDMSRVKKVNLQISTQPKTSDADYKYNLHVIAIQYNVLEIMGGMAGLQYAN